MGSALAKLAFAHDAFMAVALVLDPVLEVRRLAREVPDNGIDAAGHVAVEATWGEFDAFSDGVAMRGHAVS
jgi:hypothetical protein